MTSDDGEFACICDIGTGGPDCSEEVTYDTGYVSFGDNSFIALEHPESVDFEVKVKVLLNNTDNGVVMFVPGKNGESLAVLVVDEKIEVRLGYGDEEAVITEQDPVTLNQWYTINLNHKVPEALLKVTAEFEGTSESSGSAITSDTPFEFDGELYLGRPYNVDMPEEYAKYPSVTGTFDRKIIIDGNEVDLIEGAVNGGNIRMGFAGNPCDFTPCHADGVCMDNGDRMFSCVCPEGWSGARCETDLNAEVDPCAENPCGDNGKCEASEEAETGYKCVCVIGFAGDHCETFTPVEGNAAFDGTNWVELGKEMLPHQSSEETEVIEITLRTKAEHGLILWHGQQGDEAGSAEDYLSIGLTDGYLEFKYELGGGPAQIVSNEKLNDGEEHTVQLIRTGKLGKLIVDGGDAVEGESHGILAMLNVGGNIFIGGVPDLDLMTSGEFAKNFVGCIMSLKLKDKQVDFLVHSVAGANVSKQCKDNEPLPEDKSEQPEPAAAADEADDTVDEMDGEEHADNVGEATTTSVPEEVEHGDENSEGTTAMPEVDEEVMDESVAGEEAKNEKPAGDAPKKVMTVKQLNEQTNPSRLRFIRNKVPRA